MQATPITTTHRLFILLVFLAVTPYSFSTSLQSTTPIKLATAENFTPYAYIKEPGKWQGIDYEISSAIFKAVNIQFRPIALPRARISRRLEHGQIDGLLSTAPYNNKQHLNKLWLSLPIYTAETSVFSLKSFLLKPDDTSFLTTNKYRLGLIKNYSYQEANINFNSTSKIIEVQRDQQLAELLAVGRIDLAISEDISFIYQARHLGLFKTIIPIIELSSRPVRIALTPDFIKKNPTLPNKINKVITQLLNDGVIDAIIIKYVSLDRFSQLK